MGVTRVFLARTRTPFLSLHRGLWLAGGAALLAVLGVAAVWQWRTSGPVAVLVIEENSANILSGPLAEPPVPRFRLTEAGSAELDPALLPLPRRTRLLVYQAVASGTQTVADRLWPISSIPAAVPTGEPVVAGTRAAGEPGQVSLVRNERRLGPETVEVIGLTGQGALRLRIRGTEVVLRVGEQWAEGRASRAGLERVIPPETWDEAVGTALASGDALTVVRISYLGQIPRRSIRPVP